MAAGWRLGARQSSGYSPDNWAFLELGNGSGLNIKSSWRQPNSGLRGTGSAPEEHPSHLAGAALPLR
jgi:hypothetical protein